MRIIRAGGQRSRIRNYCQNCRLPEHHNQLAPAAFAIDIETCRHCGGRLRVIASIETPAVIERILDHLGRDGESVEPAHPSRAPPISDRLT